MLGGAKSLAVFFLKPQSRKKANRITIEPDLGSHAHNKGNSYKENVMTPAER